MHMFNLALLRARSLGNLAPVGLLGLAITGMCGSANAAAVSWATPVDVGMASDVVNSSSAAYPVLVHATATNPQSQGTVNDVNFNSSWVSNADISTGSTNTWGPGAGQFDTFSGTPNGTQPFAGATPDAAYNNLLSGGSYLSDPGTATYTMGGLTPNTSYQVQLWVYDSRGASISENLDGNTTLLFGGGNGHAGQYALGTFTTDAGSTSQAFTIDSAQVEQFNAIQVRTVPEPTSMALLASGAIGMLLKRRRKIA